MKAGKVATLSGSSTTLNGLPGQREEISERAADKPERDRYGAEAAWNPGGGRVSSGTWRVRAAAGRARPALAVEESVAGRNMMGRPLVTEPGFSPPMRTPRGGRAATAPPDRRAGGSAEPPQPSHDPVDGRGAPEARPGEARYGWGDRSTASWSRRPGEAADGQVAAPQPARPAGNSDGMPSPGSTSSCSSSLRGRDRRGRRACGRAAARRPATAAETRRDRDLARRPALRRGPGRRGWILGRRGAGAARGRRSSWPRCRRPRRESGRRPPRPAGRARPDALRPRRDGGLVQPHAPRTRRAARHRGAAGGARPRRRARDRPARARRAARRRAGIPTGRPVRGGEIGGPAPSQPPTRSPSGRSAARALCTTSAGYAITAPGLAARDRGAPLAAASRSALRAAAGLRAAEGAHFASDGVRISAAQKGKPCTGGVLAVIDGPVPDAALDRAKPSAAPCPPHAPVRRCPLRPPVFRLGVPRRLARRGARGVRSRPARRRRVSDLPLTTVLAPGRLGRAVQADLVVIGTAMPRWWHALAMWRIARPCRCPCCG